MRAQTDLVVPVKPLSLAKTRLLGAADRGIGEPGAHARLALALALDTVAAAARSIRVRHLVVISSDPAVAEELAVRGVEVIPDNPVPNLNAAYELGARFLLARDPRTPVGALQADLPALHPDELDDAVGVFCASGHARAYCRDADGTGTTLLLAAAGVALDPRFGRGSAQRHADSGAVALAGEWPGLRRDVDTSDDLRAAAGIGLGAHTVEALATAW